MNKFKLMAIALVFGAASLFANTVSNPEISGNEIRKQIIELVDNVSDNLEIRTSVNVTFSFNSEGEIVVLKVGSKDNDVLNFIRKNMNGKTIENPGKEKKKYSMVITIK